VSTDDNLFADPECQKRAVRLAHTACNPERARLLHRYRIDGCTGGRDYFEIGPAAPRTLYRATALGCNPESVPEGDATPLFIEGAHVPPDAFAKLSRQRSGEGRLQSTRYLTEEGVEFPYSFRPLGADNVPTLGTGAGTAIAWSNEQFWDRLRSEPCVFDLDRDGALRCLPAVTLVGGSDGYFLAADQNCQTQVAYGLAPSACEDAQLASSAASEEHVSCARRRSYWERGAAYAGAVYQGNRAKPASCWPSMLQESATAYVLGAEIPPHAFEGGELVSE
jgi:hypothetical protein